MIHHIDKIQDLMDDLAPADLYLAIAYLSGDITVTQAASVLSSGREYECRFLQNIDAAKVIAKMLVENDEHRRAMWKKNPPEPAEIIPLSPTSE